MVPTRDCALPRRRTQCQSKSARWRGIEGIESSMRNDRSLCLILTLLLPREIKAVDSSPKRCKTCSPERAHDLAVALAEFFHHSRRTMANAIHRKEYNVSLSDEIAQQRPGMLNTAVMIEQHAVTAGDPRSKVADRVWPAANIEETTPA